MNKWVDYSSKYGLGYTLTNQSVGVFFNDQSKILLNSNGHDFHYMESQSNEKYDTCSLHHLTDFPKPLIKKVTLM